MNSWTRFSPVSASASNAARGLAALALAALLAGPVLAGGRKPPQVEFTMDPSTVTAGQTLHEGGDLLPKPLNIPHLLSQLQR